MTDGYLQYGIPGKFTIIFPNLVHEDVVYIIPFYRRAVQAYRSDTFRGWLTSRGNLDLIAPSSLEIVEPIGQ